MLLEQQSAYNSQWAAMSSIAGNRKVGCTAETLRKWVRKTEINQGKRAGMSSTESEKLDELMRENRELKQAAEILRKAALYLPVRYSERLSEAYARLLRHGNFSHKPIISSSLPDHVTRYVYLSLSRTMMYLNFFNGE